VNISQKLLASTVHGFGAERSMWPRWRRFLLGLFIALNRPCRQDWQALENSARVADAVLTQRYVTAVDELAVSDAMSKRLQAISARPQYRASLSQTPIVSKPIPFWSLSFASAMASAILGVVIGAGGYVDEFSDPSVAYMEISMAYDVSDWLAEGSQ
jgi:hypothetical protein